LVSPPPLMPLDALSMLTGGGRRIVLLGLVMMHLNRRLGAIESTLPAMGARISTIRRLKLAKGSSAEICAA
jgi:hypothetical protein